MSPSSTSPSPVEVLTQARALLPSSWVLAPIEPADEMYRACDGALKAYIDALPADVRKPGHSGLIVDKRLKAKLRYQAMLAAAPSWRPISEAKPEWKQVLGYQVTPGDWENQFAICWAINDGRGGHFWVGGGGLHPDYFLPLPVPPRAIALASEKEAGHVG